MFSPRRPLRLCCQEHFTIYLSSALLLSFYQLLSIWQCCKWSSHHLISYCLSLFSLIFKALLISSTAPFYNASSIHSSKAERNRNLDKHTDKKLAIRTEPFVNMLISAFRTFDECDKLFWHVGKSAIWYCKQRPNHN